MTFVGKILVIVIMVFALLFLGFSAVVFTTEKNWKDETEKIRKQLSDVQGQLQRVTAEKDQVVANLQTEKQTAESEKTALNQEITNLQQAVEVRQRDIEAQRKAVETTLQAARSAQADAEARYNETTLLRDQLRTVENEANGLKDQQTDLQEKIRLLERELDVAKNNNKQLRENVVVLSNVIQQNGLDPDPERYKAIALPPDVDGEITQVDDRNQRFQISIGSDDGLVVGHELFVYRFSPRPEYLGKVRVQSVDSDQAVVSILGSTPQGKRIKEGDIVSTKIRTRD